MTNIYGAVCLGELAITALLLVRLAIGPTVSDRIVALNAMSTQATLAVLFIAAFADRSIYLDVSSWTSWPVNDDSATTRTTARTRTEVPKRRMAHLCDGPAGPPIPGLATFGGGYRMN